MVPSSHRLLSQPPEQRLSLPKAPRNTRPIGVHLSSKELAQREVDATANETEQTPEFGLAQLQLLFNKALRLIQDHLARFRDAATYGRFVDAIHLCYGLHCESVQKEEPKYRAFILGESG